VRASRVSASYGAKVGVAESGRFGGTCVNVGCIPKKLFSYAAHWREDFHLAAAYGWTVGEPKFDWQTLLRNKDKEIARISGVTRVAEADKRDGKVGYEIESEQGHDVRRDLARVKTLLRQKNG